MGLIHHAKAWCFQQEAHTAKPAKWCFVLAMASEAVPVVFAAGSLGAMQDGYTDLPPGKLASVVTYLEMRTPCSFAPRPGAPEFAIRRVTSADLDWYRALFRKIGEEWLWFSRLRMSDAELRAVLDDPAVDVFVLSDDNEDCGLLEFDRRHMPDIELSFFGVTKEMIGKGAGRALLEHGLPRMWAYNPERIWVHTCTSDHPSAVAFYQKMGFVPYKRAIEIADDPRATGELPRTAGKHVPVV
jgi:GNAT superfamily N-acetyltransferase